MKKPIIELKDISISYPWRGQVLNSLNFKLFSGERVGIIGANGSGKTTLLHIIMGLIKPDSGIIKIFGKERTGKKDFIEIRRRTGLLFQDSDDQLFSPTVEEDIAFGPLNLRKTIQEVHSIVEEILSYLDIKNLRKRFSHTLSFGEKRLVAIATTLAIFPEVLLLDEPTTALDESTTKRIKDFLLSQKSITYCIVSHDLSFLKQVSDRMYILKDGKLSLIPQTSGKQM